MTALPERLQAVIAEMRLYEGAYPPKVKVWADRLEAAQALQVAPEGGWAPIDSAPEACALFLQPNT